ncbi:MAG: TIM-barrel domain-containing protein [Rhodothermales bacterium]
MPQNAYTFLGDVTDVEPIASGVDVRAGEALVRVEAVAEGVFRVRLSPSGEAFEDPPFSYAIAPGALDDLPEVDVREEEETIRVQHGEWAAVSERRPLRISLEDAAGHRFAGDSSPMCWKGDRVMAWKEHREGEQFYGFGDKPASLDRAEMAFTNWNTDFPKFGRDTDPIYKTFPFYLAFQAGASAEQSAAPHAYGVFFDNSYRSHFDFSAEARGHTTFGADGGELRYYAFAGPEMTDVVGRYTALTGRMPLPPLWALGYHQSRWSYYPAYEVRNLAQEFRDRQIPLDSIHLDIHYMDGYRVFTWNPERFPDPAGLMRDLEAQGVKTTIIVDPGVKKEEGYRVCDKGLAEDAFVKYPDGTPYTGAVWPGECHFPDFTKLAAREWFGSYYEELLEQGVRGIWMDMNEPSNFHMRTLPDVAFHDFEGRGGTHLEGHNVYGLTMAQATYEALRRYRPDQRPFLITRAAFSGSQRYTCGWTGDNVSSWEHLGLVLPMVLSLGLSGMPLAGSDVGGFAGKPSGELYARWVQLGAFSPFFRTHCDMFSERQEPWSYGPEIEEIARTFIKLRYRLLPVFYALFDEHRQTGLPLLRPLVLHYPSDVRTHGMEDQCLLGRDLLIAPILKQGHEAREVYLPEGRWYDFWTSEAHEGGREIFVKAALNTMPIFVRAGTVLPLAPLMQYVGERAWDEVELRLFPGEGTSAFYEDDGHSHTYENGDARRTTFTLRAPSPGACTLLRESEGKFASPVKWFTIRLMDVDGPEEVRLDEQVVEVTADPAGRGQPVEDGEAQSVYDAENRTLTVRADANFRRFDVSGIG